MGWSTSIHAATSDTEEVISRLRRLGEHNCVIGHSGDGWAGIYSQRCEESAGRSTPDLAMKLSKTFEKYVLGLCLHEEGFEYWLFHHGKLLDQHPPGRFTGFFTKNRSRALLDLAKNTALKQQMENGLASKKPAQPHEILGITEEEFIEKTYKDLARVEKMSPEELKQMADKYARVRSPHYEDFRVLLEAIGIVEGDWNYSDLAYAGGIEDAYRFSPNMRLTHLD
jgi:hypothetical protein